MKAIICAAGRGSRLMPLTKKYPKPLLPLGNKTVIEHVLDVFSSCGVTEVILVVGYMADSIKQKIGAKYKNCKITYIFNKEFNHTDNLYSVWLARKEITDGMMFFNGDTLFHRAILKTVMEDSSRNSFVMASKEGSELDTNPILVHIKDGKLYEIGHSISAETHGSAIGIYKFSQKTSRDYFKLADTFFKDGPQKGGFVIPIQRLMKKVPIKPVFFKNYPWVNINTAQEYKKALHIASSVGL